MTIYFLRITYLTLILNFLLCSCQGQNKPRVTFIEYSQMKPGAERTDLYFEQIKSHSIGIVANQTSLIGNTHLVDSLVASGFNIQRIFSPEHGFRGDYADGSHIDNQIDQKTGLPIVSLYGDHKKPTNEDLQDIEILLFDIQDIGVRFYTYISTLALVMEACAENSVPLIVLDRPNPNGFYIEGPVLDTSFRSFVGMHPVPIVYGMTIGEYATMVNGEGWLKDHIKCDLQVIPVEGYFRKSIFELPVRPSPNLPNWKAVYLYPSLALFEGTIISVGRGTELPFQVFGHPDYPDGNFRFTPRSIPGASDNPLYKDQLCYGISMTGINKLAVVESTNHFTLYYLQETYKIFRDRSDFFTSYFDKLAGNKELREDIIAGLEDKQIIKKWKAGTNGFLLIREKYLIYPE